jgi:3-oxoacyl-(acyl-carrier-protein) synthase
VIYLTHYRTASTSNVELFEDIVFPQRVHWFPETYNRTHTGMFYVPHKLAEKVLDVDLVRHLRENQVGKTAFILAGGNQHFAGIGQRAYSTRLSYTYKFLPFTLTQVYAGRMAQSFGNMDMITTDASACASSLKVMMDVEVLMKHYDYQRVIVLTVEDGVSNAVLEFFGESRAVLTAKEESETGIKPSAFDSTNRGFYVGQGAALAVFESERAVQKLQCDPAAIFHGAYNASEESTNAIGQCEDGQGFIKAINGVCAYSKVSRDAIKIVKAHGTGTESNNKAEKAAILGAGLSDFVVTSYKQKIGHTMGSSGLLESLLLLDDMKKGFVPPIENRTEYDSVFLSESTKPPKGLMLSLAAGMGNIYSAAIFEGL